LQNGIFNIEVEALLCAASEYGGTRRALYTFLRDDAWQFSRATAVKRKQLYRVFDDRRTSKDKDKDKVKCSCGEALGLYGLVRPALKSERRSLKSFPTIGSMPGRLQSNLTDERLEPYRRSPGSSARLHSGRRPSFASIWHLFGRCVIQWTVFW